MQMPPSPPPSTPAEIDAALASLRAHADEWARLPISRKVDLLEAIRPRLRAVAGRWVTAASRAKGLAVGSARRGEEWSTGPWALAASLGPLAETLRHLDARTVPALLRGKVRQRADGQTVVRVLPDGLTDRLLFSGITADVWMEPGVTPESLPETVGTFYRRHRPEGRVALVLGAGNVASIAPLDVLSKLYADGQVVVLKMNPVNAYLGPLLQEAFADFVEAGYLRLVYGAADVGEILTEHPEVDEIHMTGSADTFDAIVFGTGAEGDDRKRRDAPANVRPVQSELGGVSPCVVVPGDWSGPDLRFQAERVVTSKLHNAGHNCIATQVLVLPAAWRQRAAFLGEVRAVLAEAGGRAPYYPGSADRLDALGGAEPVGEARLVEADAASDHPAFRDEVFGPGLVVTTLPGGDDPAAWLAEAADWCNARLMGTLGATILAHPRTLRAIGDGPMEDLVARFRYGTVGVNLWSGAGFFVPGAAWGAFPGHDRTDIQSGTGFVHNAYLFERPQRTVLHGPWAEFPRSLLLGETHTAPRPLWFVTNETAETTARRATEFVLAPSAGRLTGILSSALRG